MKFDQKKILKGKMVEVGVGMGFMIISSNNVSLRVFNVCFSLVGVIIVGPM